MDFKPLIRDVPDFPKKGILFKDLTTLWRDAAGLKASCDALSNAYAGTKCDLVVAPEARGFIVGVPVALALGAGFVPVRKTGKLPAEVASITYDLEYGTDTVNIHKDAIEPGQTVLLLDDLLATGGTAGAICKLVRQLGGKLVGAGFLVELAFLKGRENLDVPITSILTY